MSICSALVALSFVVAQGEAQIAPLKVDGKEIPLRLVSTPAAPAPADFLSWDGWQYLSSTPTKVWEPYSVAADWSEVSTRYEAAKAVPSHVWRSKVFVLSRTESTQRDANGVLRTDRDSLTPKQLQETLEAIARTRAWITAEFEGKVRFEPDVQVENDTLRWNTYGPEFAQWYVAPRINGGTYVAEDKVFRGPFNSALYILPGFNEKDPAGSIVNGTPVSGVYANLMGMPVDAGRLEVALRQAWLQQVAERLRMQGYRGSAAAEAADPWAIATAIEEPATATLLQRLREGKGLDIAASAVQLKTPIVHQWKAPGTDVEFVDDPDRGRVLKVVEKPNYRLGGVALPLVGEPISTVEVTPTLSFFIKSTDRDPISIRVQGRKGAFWVSAGRDPLLSQPTSAVVGSAPFEDNGQWQKVAVDLRPLAQAAGVTEIVGLAIEPSPNAVAAEMLEFGSGEYSFDDIKLSTEPATALLPALSPDFASTDPEARALAAAKATESTPALVAAVKDGYPIVRLNATAAYTKLKDPTVESALVSNTNDLSAPIQEQALLALANLGTESAKATLRQTIRYTIGDLGKATAARLLAETGDAKYAGDILVLFAGPSWQSAIVAVEALAKLPTVNSQARHPFLRNEIPAVRLEVVRLADAKVASDRSALMWHALNDPSDLVRATAYMKLIDSGDAETMTEGYKGVRDESRFTRILLLDLLANSPRAQHRPSIMIGLADGAPLVRAAALRALASDPGAVTTDDLGPFAEDRHPEVLLSLAQLSKTKGLKLPASTVAAMKESPDKRVRDAAAGL